MICNLITISGSWNTMSSEKLDELVQRLSQPTVASVSRSEDCINRRYLIESCKQKDMDADIGLPSRPSSRQSSLMSSLMSSRPNTRQRSPSPNQRQWTSRPSTRQRSPSPNQKQLSSRPSTRQRSTSPDQKQRSPSPNQRIIRSKTGSRPASRGSAKLEKL